jgi:hypothetical protein
MRLRLLAPMLLLAAACGAPTGPDAARISVRLLNEAGQSAGRNQVIVRPIAADAARRVDTGTDQAGRVEVRLDAPGTYEVWVVPRQDFVGAASLIRAVTVGPNERVVVEFTLRRDAFDESRTPGFAGSLSPNP